MVISGRPLPGMPGAKVGPVPVIRMFGITAEGNSVVAHIHGFSPYFFVPAQSGFKREHCEAFKVGVVLCVCVLLCIHAVMALLLLFWGCLFWFLWGVFY